MRVRERGRERDREGERERERERDTVVMLICKENYLAKSHDATIIESQTRSDPRPDQYAYTCKNGKKLILCYTKSDGVRWIVVQSDR